MKEVSVTTFYRFTPLSEDQVAEVSRTLEEIAAREHVRGLCLVGSEGVNATVSGSRAGLEAIKSQVSTLLGVRNFKDSVCDKHPFNEFKVKIKNEIVTIGLPGLVPSSDKNNHLSPKEWQNALQEPDTVVLDTRNRYEIDIGKFRGATDLKIDEFNEFGPRLQEAQLPKDKKYLIYCTGGIRCEKAILEMKAQGFKSVFQLDGGILNYLNEFPNEDFDGECFVFDYRVAVDQELRATNTYRLCPHCGQPASSKLSCVKCGREEYVCPSCTEAGVQACSKNCANHLKRGSDSRKPHLQELKKRQRP